MNKHSQIFYFFTLVFFLLVTTFSAIEGKEGINPRGILKKELSRGEKIKNHRENEIIIKYKKKEIDLQKAEGKIKADNFEKAKGLQKVSEIKNLNIRLVKISDNFEEKLSKLNSDSSIEIAEPNYLKSLYSTPNDPGFELQWGLQNTGQILSIDGINYSGTNDADIDAPEAWDLESDSNGEIVVAIIDTGTRITHHDLTANIWTNPGEIPGNGIDDDGNGYTDDVHGWDFKDNDNNPDDSEFLLSGQDVSGHGTFISGIISAVSDNNIGISGISQKNKIKTMPLRFGLDSYSEIEAINYAKNNGAHVINVSFGGSSFSSLEKEAIDSFLGIVVTPSGNESIDNDLIPLYPCNYSSTNVICVASTNQKDLLSDFSNYGQNSVDLAAPGENILSTDNASDDSYAYWSGTSFSAPLVAGAAAMLISKDSFLTVSDLKNRLLSNGDNLKSCLEGNSLLSGKRLNLNNSLNDSFSPTPPLKCTPIYRFWSDTKQGHFYTASETEKNHIISTYPYNVWKYEGIAYNSYNEYNSEIVPVYRFWSDTKQHHFYTASEAEKNQVISAYNDKVWRYEGVAFYAYNSLLTETKPVFRFWSDQKQSHFYTSSASEKSYVTENYDDFIWRYEGVAWYVPE